MPIRINLLAAEKEAEELRRRDPIKRAVFGGCALVALTLGWIGITQIQVMAARSELSGQSGRLANAELSSKQVRLRQLAAMEAIHRVKSLDQYSANRFLWGNFLDALQRTSVDSVRLTEIRTEQRYGLINPTKFFSTNITVTFTPPAPFWKFWASSPQGPQTEQAVASLLPGITNSPAFLTNSIRYTMKVSDVATNVAAGQITTAVEFSNVPATSEEVTVEIRGRDYGTPSGAAIDEFAKRLTASPYFKQVLSPTKGYRFTERPPQPRADMQDGVNPGALFVPFTIELVLNTRTFINHENVQR